MIPRVVLLAALGLALPATAQTSAPARATAAGQPDPPGQPAGQPPEPGPAWLPRGGAELQVLDKINARERTLTVRGGDTVQFGSLSIAVRSCVVRPPDQPADAAAFLVVTDAHPDQPAFRGWMFRSDPAVSMMQHPIYDIRILGCHA
jgi:hypothetical protein